MSRRLLLAAAFAAGLSTATPAAACERNLAREYGLCMKIEGGFIRVSR